VFDNINDYTEEDMEELKNRKQDFGVGDRVRCIIKSPFLDCEGLVVKRDENINGDPVWTVDFEGAGTVTCMLSHELERVWS
jgi:transcription antitermination factor NusG